jgi:hypothetical protein
MTQEESTTLPVGRKKDGTPQKRSNQWLKAKEVQGKVNERDRDKVRAEALANHLEKHVYGKAKLSQTQVQAAKILIDKGKPSLASVEQTTHEAPLDEAETVAKLAHLLAANPALLRPLLELDPGLRASLKSVLDGVPTVVNTLPRTATSLNNPENDSQQAVNT